MYINPPTFSVLGGYPDTMSGAGVMGHGGFDLRTFANIPDREKWLRQFPVSGRGVPSSVPAFRIIEKLFNDPRTFHRTIDLASELNLHPDIVSVICGQLLFIDLVSKQLGTDAYKYQLDSDYFELQAMIESNLDDGQMIFEDLKFAEFPVETGR